MSKQKSAEAVRVAAHGNEGPNNRIRIGTMHSRREADVASRAEMPEQPREASGSTAHGPMAERQTHPACKGKAETNQWALMEEVVRRDNVMAAYQRVVQNKGAAGVDGLTVNDLMLHCRAHWEKIRRDLLSGSYQPLPVRKVEIPKPDGKGMRMLGIPSVLDRLIQQSLLQILQPIFDPTFSGDSFGFRPGRGTHDAVKRAYEHITSGYTWVIDLDLEKFFDRVNHDVLMARVAKRVKDKRVLKIIRRYLQAGIMENGITSHRTAGTPQGSPLSPLLSNIILDDLDKELERRGHRFARYADDCNVYVQSEAAGKRVMSSLETFLDKRLRLKINREKSAVARPWDRKFLGFSVTRNRKPRLKVASQSISRLQGKLKPIWRRGRGRNIACTIKELNPIIRGWVAYFRLANVKMAFSQLDPWVNRKLRCILWRQWKTPGTRFKKLRKLGVDPDRAYAGATNNYGPWRNAGYSQMNQAIPIKMLRSMGLVSFVNEYQRLRASIESPDAERHVR